MTTVTRTNLHRLAVCMLAVAVAMSVLFIPTEPAQSDDTGRFIVQASNSAQVHELVAPYGGVVIDEIPVINGAVVDMPAGNVRMLEIHPSVASVTPDASIEFLAADESVGIWEVATSWTRPYSSAGSLYEIADTIEAEQAWGMGVTGSGVTVALIDSGVTPVKGLANPGKLRNGPDLSFESQSTELRYIDTFGHGTHLAGIIGGRDSSSPDYEDLAEGLEREEREDAGFLGVAPDSSLLSVKVANHDGATDVSQVIAAIDWVVQHRNDLGMNVRVINLSFGTDGVQDYLLDPLAFAVEQAWKAGIVVVVAAGNDGNSSRLRNPALDPFVIAVGAADGGRVADFSNCGDPSRSVDLVAPGRSVISLRSPGSNADTQYPSARVEERFFLGSGTSQAAAVVSGAAALLLDYRPDLTPDQVKGLLMKAATPLTYADGRCQGSGLVNVIYAMKWAGTDLSDLVQKHTPSTGTGSLEGARGSFHVSVGGVDLTGEQDIFGSAWNGEEHAKLTASGVSWSGGDWNGVSWSGVSWSGVSWSGVSWSGVSWSGVTWSGLSWSSSAWSGVSWD